MSASVRSSPPYCTSSKRGLCRSWPTNSLTIWTNAEKIFVFRQNETLSANDLFDFRMALADYGPSTLLWVQQARPGHAAGSVDRIEDTLLVGYVQRLASRENAPDLDLPSWLLMLRRALVVRSAVRKLWRDANVPDAVRPACIELTFGREETRERTRFGWSPAEDNHTFAIDERSLLTFPPPRRRLRICWIWISRRSWRPRH